MASSIIRKTNIQGDIWPGLPKRFQSFLFFQIHKPNEFKQRLKQFTADGHLTTAEQACEMKNKIDAAKKACEAGGVRSPLMPLPGVNIAFSSTGLHKMGKFVQASDQEAYKRDRELNKKLRKMQLRGGLFEKGMYDDLVGEGWDLPDEIRPEYKPLNVSGKNVRQIDGVLTVTSSVDSDLLQQVERVTSHFVENGIVSLPLIRNGHVRPDKEKGKEHFGFADGISQPQIIGLDDQCPPIKPPGEKEPKPSKPGMILCGHEGDTMGQPAWAKDGSFLAFRDLQQMVPEFDNWLDKNAPTAPLAQGHERPAEKLAAHLMGRWRNGTPVHESPDKDDDPELFASNNFDYEPREVHDKCPFAAHTRKMRPRADLSHDHAVILRRGIPYGPEVTSEEKATKETTKDRGLLFACYQSDIRNGFNFLTTRWASNHAFPNRKHKFVGEHGPGIDAIVGQRQEHHPERSIGLPDGKDPTEHRMKLESWVVQRGGDYFFAPSIEAITDYLTGPNDYDTVASAKL
ncbi:hypothetical protein Q7P37_008118 [Cladosporium fusiforme]